ncbi:MAG: hypothetical protein K8T26_15010 [Lentisphaerae bacterium]|nr:hypothetical protein [Lentisphaerota bacterium]
MHPTLLVRNERRIVIVVLAMFVALNMATSTLYPPINADEVLFTDPAINLANGLGFRSTAWYTQPFDAIFAGNAPLYSLLLAAWLRMTAFTPMAVRALNYFLMAASGLLLWQMIRRTSVIASVAYRLLFLLAVLGGEGTALAYRMGRYDALGILVISAIVDLSTREVKSKRTRAIVLFILGALVVAAGYQNIFAIFMVSLLTAWMLSREQRLAMNISVYLGMLCGVCMLGFTYHAIGSWEYFMASLMHHGEVPATLAGRVKLAIAAVGKDHSSILLLTALALLALPGRSGPRVAPRPLLLAGAALVALPFTMGLLWRFQDYYSWMKYVPGLACILIAISGAPDVVRAQVRTRTAVALIGLAALGFPARLATAGILHARWDYSAVQRFIDREVAADDIAVISPVAYYEAKSRANAVFMDSYVQFLGAEEKRGITVLLCHPAVLTRLEQTIGGDWSVISEYGAETMTGNSELLRVFAGWPAYDLVACRRSGVTPQ